MSEDELREKIGNIAEDLAEIKKDGRSRSEKINEICLRVERLDMRVDLIDKLANTLALNIDKVEKRVWQVATVISIAMPGVAKLTGLF